MNNVMLDLETWGTRPGCAIRSVGAVVFDPTTGDMGDEYYSNVSDESCVMAGLFVDDSTAAWWEKQSQEAQDALTVEQRGIYVVVQEFHAWFRKNKGVFLWSQGANFDEVIWSAIAHRLGQRVPWRYGNVRDTRTAYEIAKLNPFTVKREGTYHNALDDARHQAMLVSKAYRKVGWR